MSYENYEKAIELAENCDGYCIGGEKSKDVVDKAKELFGFPLSKQNVQYFSKYGYIEFFGNEFYGIVKDDFSGTPTGCAIEAAIIDRKKYGLPKEWLPIYFFDDGYMGYLDYSHLNKEGEPRVIMAIYTGKQYGVVEVIAEDFGDFLLQRVESQLANQ